MLTTLSEHEIGAVVGAGGPSINVNVNIDPPKIISEFGDFIGATIKDGWDGGEARVNSLVTNNNADWTTATNGWVFDKNSGMYAIDTDHDGFFNYAGNYNGCVFSIYDGVSWTNNMGGCGDPLPGDQFQDPDAGFGGTNPY